MTPVCNVCGSDAIVAGGMRGLPVCTGCSAHPVTRVIWLFAEALGLLEGRKRVLHIAPERALAPRLRALFGDGYEPVDYSPENYAHVPGTRKFDLCADVAGLPGAHYDLILHSHVMEHVRCNVSAVLGHLHRALKPGGVQLCCVPFRRGAFSGEDLGPLSGAEMDARFGQDDHVRIFGAEDVATNLGLLFRLPAAYDLVRRFGAARLDAHAIPEVARAGWTAHSVLALTKGDLRIA